jgi:hypothetical protein
MRVEKSGVQLPFLQNGIAQVGILVEDLDQAVENYWKVGGIGPWQIYTYQRPLVKAMHYRGQPADYKMRIALTWIGALCIELIEIVEGPSIYQEFVESRGYGLHHLGVVIEDAETGIAQAEAAGYAVIQDGSGYGLQGDGCYAYLDTEAQLGIIIELMQLPKVRVPPERIYPPQATSEQSGEDHE